eukprot:CCRYP_012401-RA/>CCRYP_012401-RA protein AED:0.19 eAED:0.31 QI:494/0/0.5/1/0/0/2/0/83
MNSTFPPRRLLFRSAGEAVCSALPFPPLELPPVIRDSGRNQLSETDKMKHKIMNRKSSIQLEYEKLAEQYGVSKSDLKMQVHV